MKIFTHSPHTFTQPFPVYGLRAQLPHTSYPHVVTYKTNFQPVSGHFITFETLSIFGKQKHV